MTKPQTWKMRDGTVIRIRDMDDRHLLNTIAMLHRNQDRARTMLYFQMGAYAADHDTIAADCVGQEADRLLDSDDPADVFPDYNNLVREAERRKLTIPGLVVPS